MPTYQFLLHTTRILLKGEREEDAPAIGFYSWRRARGKNSQEAYEAAMEAMDHDPKLRDIMRSAHEAGLRPRTVAEKTYEIPWWKTLVPWRQPGLMLYETDDDDHDDTTPE